MPLASLPNRRDFLNQLSGLALSASVCSAFSSLVLSSGCTKSTSGSALTSNLVFGKLGLSDGRFQKPRALAIDRNNLIYVADKTGRIQVFNTQGEFLRGWRTPEIANGKPTGLSIDNDGNLMVADTHYHRILFYTPTGALLGDKTLGGSFGPEPGQMAFVTDCVQRSDGTYYVSEYGAFDRIQKYAANGEFLGWFGEHGDAVLQFSRPQNLALDEDGLLWIADSCNHRIQVYDWRNEEPIFIRGFGRQGSQPGQFRYPYGIWLGDQCVYIAEYGGHRIQKLTREGVFIKSWGSPGAAVGQLNAPWSIVLDSQGMLYAVDSGNNRIQRFSVA